MILPRQLTPLSFYLRETYRICNFLANCCDYTRKQYKAPISLSPVYETSSKTGSGIRFLYLLTGPIWSKSVKPLLIWRFFSIFPRWLPSAILDLMSVFGPPTKSIYLVFIVMQNLVGTGIVVLKICEFQYYAGLA